jgi:cystathionine beta-lyase family protein involved in aluminum resistance
LENKIAANTNYIGLNSVTGYKQNILGQGSVVTPSIAPQPDWIVPDNDNDVAGGTSQWVRAAGTIAEGATCTVAAGAATSGAGAYSCYVKGGVVLGDFFWAVTTADT